MMEPNYKFAREMARKILRQHKITPLLPFPYRTLSPLLSGSVTSGRILSIGCDSVPFYVPVPR